MNHKIFLENQKKRIDYPLSRLLCFAMFVVWQMGIIFYLAPGLTINGKTPLPISMDNVTTLIIFSYIAAIIFTVILPQYVIQASRLTSAAAFISIICLFFPFSPEAFAILLYVQCFCCCFMITFETVTITFYFSEKSALLHLLVAYPIGYFIVSFLQNDIAPLPFRWFRIGSVVFVGLLSYFYFKLPTDRTPRLVKKSDHLKPPVRMFISVFILIFLASLLGVTGPAVAAEAKHGVSALYISAAVIALIIYVLWKKKKIHPIKATSISIGLSAIGFLLLFVSTYIPEMALPSCALIGAGMVACSIIPLFELAMMKQYPTRFIPVITIIFALCAVMISTALIEIFANNIHALYLSYLIIVVFMLVIYLQLAPFLSNVLQSDSASEDSQPVIPEVLSCLTAREMDVAKLISNGLSNKDIAHLLFISEHTVKDHTKNIYRKLNIHSRFELAALFNK